MPRDDPPAGFAALRQSAQRWWYVLRYHRASQLWARLARTVARPWTRRLWRRRIERPSIALPGLRDNEGLTAASRERLRQLAGPASQARAEAILEGRYEFLHVERQLSPPIDWRLTSWPEAPHLWRFQLHYHEFLLDLAAAAGSGKGPKGTVPFSLREDGDRSPAWSIVGDWIAHNRLGDPRVMADAWHPYCISRRLPAWIRLWSAGPPEGPLGGRVQESMVWQMRYLERHLERDLGGNHLLENLRAMAIVGSFLAGSEADRWLATAERLLRRELAEQILPHGEHFERSPAYHAQMLGNLLDVAEAAAGPRPALAEFCRQTAAAMCEFLREILHPDGEVPLLGDSFRTDLAPVLAAASLQASGGRRPRGLSPPPGVLRRRDPAQRVASAHIASAPVGNALGGVPKADAALPLQATKRRGGRSLPARAGHLLHDPAEEPGQAGIPDARDSRPWQANRAAVVGDYWISRSGGDFLLFDAGRVGPDQLPAHAHADLLGLEASIGGRRLLVDSGVYDYAEGPMRRYCRSTAAHNVLEIDGTDQCDLWSRFRMGHRGWPSGLTCGREAGFAWARAEHNAYRRRDVPVVGRWLACRPGGPWFCVDWADGRGRHDLVSRLHLHPAVTVARLGDAEFQLRLGDTVMSLAWLTPGRAEVAAGWYCADMGRCEENPVLTWRTSGPLPAVSGWCLTWGELEGTAALDVSDPRAPLLRWNERQQTVTLRARPERA